MISVCSLDCSNQSIISMEWDVFNVLLLWLDSDCIFLWLDTKRTLSKLSNFFYLWGMLMNHRLIVSFHTYTIVLYLPVHTSCWMFQSIHRAQVVHVHSVLCIQQSQNLENSKMNEWVKNQSINFNYEHAYLLCRHCNECDTQYQPSW